MNHPYNGIELKDAPTYLGYWIKMNELGEHKKEDWVEPCYIIPRLFSANVMLSPRVLRTVSESAYVFLVLLTVVATVLSCAAILSQAVRTSPTRSWSKNFNALVVGASYIILVSSPWALSNINSDQKKLAASVLFCIKRRVAVRIKLQRISKTYNTIGRGDLPDVRINLSLPPSSYDKPK